MSAYASLNLSELATVDADALIGRLTGASAFETTVEQRHAWNSQIPILREQLAGLEGRLFLEFDVPRLGSRIDAVVVTGPAVFPIEFKVGESRITREARNQAWDYALDLKNFHRASHTVPILPVLIATEARTHLSTTWAERSHDDVWAPFCSNASGLGVAIRSALFNLTGPAIDPDAWGAAPYQPTPTIVQAARALYARHTVDEISRSDADARNLAVTSKYVENVIDEASRSGEKSIVFVTGVPGAGKTLVGLNVATQRRDPNSPTHAVFLSGNAPLVAVLQEALVRDEWQRLRAREPNTRKGEVRQQVKPFIQIVHHFRDEGVRLDTPPNDRVVVFDEAQRAWNLKKTSTFMRMKKGVANFSQSEPEFLIRYMDRHPDWAVVVCLVGGGQEINTGEAGIGEWLAAVRAHFRHWRVHISPNLQDSEYAAVEAIEQLDRIRAVRKDADLHLSVSMRSFRSERVSSFVKAVLDGESLNARELMRDILPRYPIVLTRSLDCAKQWVRARARGSERYGLLASSRAERLKPHAIDVRVDVDPVKWFLNDQSDTRSSYYLEDAATEFDVQGLELDWTLVTWDADLRRSAKGWSHHGFRGDKWVNVLNSERRKYLLNAYRVLLTRARQGMAVFVPEGDRNDPTRHPDYYAGIFEYLSDVGIPVIPEA